MNEINMGVSAKELENALSQNNGDINDLKDFIIKWSQPLPRKKIDPFLIMEEIYRCLERCGKNKFNKEHFLKTLRDYFEKHNHPWTGKLKEENAKWFDRMDTDHNGVISRDEIFGQIFRWFDKNNDTRLNDTEIKTFYEEYAKFLGRRLKADWWTNIVEPAIRKMEGGVSIDELFNFMEQQNSQITDFRKAVISLSHPDRKSVV